MIQNAKDVLLSFAPGTLPNVSDALLDYFQPLTFIHIVKTVVNFKVEETQTVVNVSGVRQPFTAEQLMIKPEGERSWRWETLHVPSNLLLNPDEIVNFAGIPYRVMQKFDWSQFGYFEYHLIEDFR